MLVIIRDKGTAGDGVAVMESVLSFSVTLLLIHLLAWVVLGDGEENP